MLFALVESRRKATGLPITKVFEQLAEGPLRLSSSRIRDVYYEVLQNDGLRALLFEQSNR
jgi:hypothetical protein